MTPVYQRTASDCFRCCLATVLAIPYEDAPDLSEDSEWLDHLVEWARREHGLRTEWATDPADVPGGQICLMGTEWNGEEDRSRRGHEVVSRGAYEIVHEPRVQGSNSYGPTMHWIWFTPEA